MTPSDFGRDGDTRADADAAPPRRDGQSGRLLHGQMIEVRSARDIAATLDGDGRLEGVPFMPEMADYCGRRFRVFRRADITCVEGHGLRRMDTTVFLADVRCNGAAHDGCQRHCLIFWKEAWLKPVADAHAPTAVPSPPLSAAPLAAAPTHRHGRYVCQSTVLASATHELPSWNLLPFVSQMRDGELTLARFVLIIALAVLNMARKAVGLRDVGRLAGARSKSAPDGLALVPGDWVRVKSHADIQRSLDSSGRNRGLLFEPEMSDYAGKRFQVNFAVTRMIHEETGQMIHPTRTVTLKGLTCHGLCAKSCPRSNLWFWREDWLERAPAPPAEDR